MQQKTKIIATIGPSCNNYKTLHDMVINGLNVVRINVSHGIRSEHQLTVDLVKQLRKDLNVSLPLMLDTRGPEVRVCNFEEGLVKIKKGQTFTFTAKNIVGNNEKVSITHNIFRDLKNGGIIFACDGLLKFKITQLNKDNAICRALNSGYISNRKGLFFPGVKLNFPYLNDEDKSDILWAIENNFEFVAGSFVNCVEDVKELKNFIASNNGNMEVIAKIESKLGVKNLDDILENVFGIMVARGDLGVEIPLQKLPEIQKDMITRSRLMGKISITATEMLESMTSSPRPTRAEASDVANAVFDGSSAIMLSGETAIGKYPVQVVKTMSSIAKQAEKSFKYYENFHNTKFNFINIPDIISHSAVSSSFSANTKAIVVATDSGRSPRMLSRFRPMSPIVALTDDKVTFQKLGLSWGVLPIYWKVPKKQLNALITTCNDLVKELGLAKAGDVISITSASRTNEIDTDFLKLHQII